MTDKEKKELLIAFRKAKKNLINYRHILLTNGDDEVGSPPFHYDWSDRLLHNTKSEAIQGFRESAKSQYVLRAFSLYCLTFPSKKRDYVILIKNNATLARNKLKEIELEYTTNPAISGNCVKIREQSGEVFSVDVEDAKGKIVNIRFEAYGKGASIRGLSNQDRRPKICIIDDPQDIEDAKSETVVASDWEWFLSDVKFLGRTTRIFIIGNNLGEKCMIERIFNNAKELRFEISKVPTLVKGESTWPQRYSLEAIETEKENFRRIGKLEIWLREKMCEATSEETQIINRNDFKYYVPNIVMNIAANSLRWATLDPASSVDKTAAFRAIVVNLVDSKGFWFIADVSYGRWDSKQLVDKIFDTVIQWKLTDFGIEKGIFKQVLEPFIVEQMSVRKVFFNVIPLEHAKIGSKLERIKLLQPRFKAGTIFFPERAPWLAEMEGELLSVTKDGIKSMYTDLMDALAMQTQIVKAPLDQTDEMKPLPRYAMPDNTNLGMIVNPGYQPGRLPRQATSVTPI